MLEEHVAFYLQKYLGNYVKGLSKEALKISAWQGNVELTSMELKPEALNALKLPIKVKAGFLGSVKLKVPWSRLGKEPVLVLLDRIFILAELDTTTVSGVSMSDQEAKRQKIKETEQALLDARLGEPDKSEVNNSWLGSLISTIIGNLKLSITNIHIRYEDSESNPGHPFAAGLTLEKLAAVTVGEDGKEAFITSGPLDRIQKAGELQGLSLYLEPDSRLWHSKKEWEKLSPDEWSKIFEPRIKVHAASKMTPESMLITKGHYLLQPVDATARYTKLGSGDLRPADKEIQNAVLNLDDVTLSLSQAQYRDILKLMENINAFRKRAQYAHYRPTTAVKDDPKSWWKYAISVTIEQIKRIGGRLSWQQIVKFARLRKKYLSLYINCLQSDPQIVSVDDNKEIQQLESELDADVAVQWRMLAHSFVDKTRKHAIGRKQKKGGWWSSLWGGDTSDNSIEPRSLTEEDWRQINQVIGYQERSDSALLSGQDPPDMLHTVLEVSMRHNATKIVDENGANVIELSAEELHCATKLYPEMKRMNFDLGSYYLCSPEGYLAESETIQNAISGEFVYLPLDKSVDWSLSVKALPCYITYLMSSINEVGKFFQNPSAVSQTVALETAAALQATYDEVVRSAQKQLNEALKEKPRFSLDLDIAAPKVLVPSEFYPDGKRQSKLLLDLGHLALQTQDPSTMESDEEKELYMHFGLGLSDVQAFLIDGKFDWKEHYRALPNNAVHLELQDFDSHLPVLERCGITMALHQICVPHPLYPSTRLAVRLPSLGFHFSPARYHRLMQILKVFQSSSSDESESSVKPWNSPDLEGEVSVLAWKGVGNREAVWQRQYVALACPFLYVVESPSASSFKRRVSLIGKQVIFVAPEFIGGALNVLAICDLGHFSNKVAESANTLLLRFDSEDSRETWKGRLQAAIYRFAAPAAVSDIFPSGDQQDAKKGDRVENPIIQAADKEDFFLTGALDELKIVISSGSIVDIKSSELILLAKEHPLLELRALGSKVEFVMKKFDMVVGAVLEALEVEDKFSSKGSCPSRYLARSDKLISQTYGNTKKNEFCRKKSEDFKTRHHGKGSKDSRDMFFDTEEDLGDVEGSSNNRLVSRSMSDFYDAEDFENSENDLPKMKHVPGLLPELDIEKTGQLKVELQDNFVKAQVILFSLDSPAYKNVDKQIIVSLATLSFFCNRPTIMALLKFSDAITAEVATDVEKSRTTEKGTEDGSSSICETDDIVGSGSKPAFDHKDSVVKGLLGSGKDRVLLSLVLSMHQAMIILDSDDGRQIASLAQEELSSEIKVFPSSFGVTASLGNLRITDDRLDNEHPYRFICDTRNPESTSFIQIEFFSFNKDDSDYEGYEYSLFGRLSEVRFVYLNRFVQEISSYFMGLVPQTPGYIVKISNRVTNAEKFFTQSEVEGSPGIKLDISLTKPIIIMPRETKSRDFLELDILQIEVKNSLVWIGGNKDNPGAVRLDNIVLRIEDIHMSVGVRGKCGDGIIKKANGLSLRVTRSLRDLWHQVPAVHACIAVEELKADISAKEYQVIIECASSNLAEKPNLLPPVSMNEKGESSRGLKQDTKLEESELAPVKDRSVANKEGRVKEGIWITMLLTAHIEMVELSLFTGESREHTLATSQVSGMWVAYKTTSNEEMNVMATLGSVSVKDEREGTEPEMQYMIGQSNDVDDSVSGMLSTGSGYDCAEFHLPVTMLVMDAKLTSDVQMVSLRIQQPKLLVAVDFLFALTEFFVPSIHSLVSDPKIMNEDTIDFEYGIYLDKPVFRQQSTEIIISPRRPLVADNFTVENYIYDGRSGTLRLQTDEGKDLEEPPEGPLIIIGNGKRLRFKNLVIQGGDMLDSSIFLGVDSSYSISESDAVYINSIGEKSVDGSEPETEGDRSVEENKEPLVKELIFDLQAIGPELTFYDSMSGHIVSQVAERLIRAKMDMFSRFVMKGNDMELNAKVNGLSIEVSSGLTVVEPVNAEVKYSSVSGKRHVHATLSEILVNMSFRVLQLVLKLQEDISSFLRITTKQKTVQCYQFDKIWTDDSILTGQRITFWRPRAPPGFTVLGDCVTPSDEPIAKGVLALNMSLNWFKRPIQFQNVWSSADYGQSHVSKKGCSIWMPIPPTGYLAFGCVVTEGMTQPTLSSAVCVLERIATSSAFKDCIVAPDLKGRNDNETVSFLRVDNSVSSFFVASKPSDVTVAYELLHVRKLHGFPKVQGKGDGLGKGTLAERDDNQGTDTTLQSIPSMSMKPVHALETVASFKLVWWNKNRDSEAARLSIWRPILPSGCVLLGDIALRGYEPPSAGAVFRDCHDGKWVKKPLYLEEIGTVQRQRSIDKVSFWFPVAPAGYSGLGCIAVVGDRPDQSLLESIGCVRNDMLVQTRFLNKLLDCGRMRGSGEVISIWPVENVAQTFIAVKGSKLPQQTLALNIAEDNKASLSDNLTIDAEVKNLSTILYDDFRGLMVPLLNLSLLGVNGRSHGTIDRLSSAVNFSLAAQTFNGRYYAWEPLIEPFDGFIRHFYKQSSPPLQSNGSESHLKLVSTSPVNLNLSVANMNMMLEAYSSWNKLSQIMESSKSSSMAGYAPSSRRTKPALNIRQKRNFQIILDNKLQQDVSIRTMDTEGQEKLVCLVSGQSTIIDLPTSSNFLDPDFKGRNKSVRLVAVLIGSAKLHHNTEYVEQRCMVTIRIFPECQTADKRQLEQQTARTRCVRPIPDSNSTSIVAQWNEVFFFEVEYEEACVVEMMVNEIATGLGIGYCSFSFSCQQWQNMITQIDNEDKPMCNFQMEARPLTSINKSKGEDGADDVCGQINYAISLLSNLQVKELHTSGLPTNLGLRPGIIQVSYKNEDHWTYIGLTYATRATCWQLCQDTIVTETILEDENKRLMLRSLVVVVNNADFAVDIGLSMCSPQSITPERRSLLKGTTNSNNGESALDLQQIMSNLAETDEVFENERYQPMLGWGSTWPGHFLPTDPRHWSKHDYSLSVQEFPEAKLPLGWDWKGNWEVDKVEAGDEDGWCYGLDFKTLRWPTSVNSKEALSFVRRRRWIRLRERSNRDCSDPMSLGTLEPSESFPVPISSLRSNSPDYKLQVRPHGRERDKYDWSVVVLSKGQVEARLKWQHVSEISLRSLMEAQELVCCTKQEPKSVQPKAIWFVLDVQAKEVGMTSQLDPLKDWRIIITAPLILYNYLPVSSEYVVMENIPGTGMVVKERGVVGPGKEAQVFHADIQRALYLHWIPQGGWQPEELPVLICHPHKKTAKYIKLTNFSTGRVLQVYIDSFPDAKLIAKRFRCFVPCWLDIENLPPLICKFVEFKDHKKFNIRSSSHEKILDLIQFQEMSGQNVMVSSFNMEKMAISIALAESNEACFEPPTPLSLLSVPDANLELRALNASETQYYKVLVSAKLCPYPGVPTKIMVMRPFITFTNRLGEQVYLRHSISQDSMMLNPSDWRITFPVLVTDDIEILQMRLNNTEWSLSFKIKQEETLHVAMRTSSSRRHHVRIEIRGYEEGSRFLVVFRQGSIEGPFRLENYLTRTTIQYRQKGLGDDAWQLLKPCSAELYAWEDPSGTQFLEALVEDNRSIPEFFDINKLGNYYPCVEGVSRNFYCQVLELGSGDKIFRFCETRKRILQTRDVDKKELADQESQTDQMQSYELLTVESSGSSSSFKLEIQLDLCQFGLSVIDMKVREILYLSMKNLSLQYGTGYASSTRRMDILLGYLQLDNQLPLSALPVLLVPEEGYDEQDHVFKVTVINFNEASDATEVYSYIGVKFKKSPWRVNIHEPVIWAIMDFYDELHLEHLAGGSEVGQVDPEIRIDLLDISEVRLKLTLETSPRQRPRGVLGIWSPVVSALGNTSKMPIHLRPVVNKNRYIRKSAIGSAIIGRLWRDLIHNPIMLLSGLDVLGMTSSTLATLSETVAELSSDGKFLQLRSKQDRSRRIGGVSDGLMQGSEAIAQGVVFGVSGVIRKPIEKAKEGGIVGFFQGLGKAAIGIVMEPMSGVLDFVSLTVGGVGASCSKWFEFFDHEQSFRRVRLPRAVPPNGILCCYDEKAAIGQAILHLAEGRGRVFDGIFFKEPSKFAWTDFYVDHFSTVNNKIVMITNKHIVLLQNHKLHRKARLHMEPSIILWDVPWEDLLALELACTSNDQDPVYIVLHLRNHASVFARLIKCALKSGGGLAQAKDILMQISTSWKTYGPGRSSILQAVKKRHFRFQQTTESSSSRMMSEQVHLSNATGESVLSPPNIQDQENGDWKEIFHFKKILSTDQVIGNACSFCIAKAPLKDKRITIWRPILPEGYVSVGDIAHAGEHAPCVSIAYKRKDNLFAPATEFDLVWRSWREGYVDSVSIWMPKAPSGFVALGCVAVNALVEPEVGCVWCVHSSLAEDAEFEQELWHAPKNSAWSCHIYPIASEALTFMALRQTDQLVTIHPKRVIRKQSM